MGQMIVLIIPSLFAYWLLHDLSDFILSLDRSKTAYKKIMYEKRTKEKFLLKGYCEQAKSQKKTMQYLTVLNYVYIFTFIIMLVSLIVCLITLKFCDIIRIFMYAKIMLLDMQIYIYALLHSKHLKNGGISWKL